MARHMTACLKKSADKLTDSAGREVLHLIVDEPWPGPYWLHLAVAADATLADLDQFLRKTWVECCGHLSQFRIGEHYYTNTPMPMEGDRSMDVLIGEVLPVGGECLYEYDMGSTTQLRLRVKGRARRPGGEDRFEVLARNEPLELACVECGEPATQLCPPCAWSEDAWFCDDCAQDHECGEEMLLPIVNSPRCGVCAYTGPWETA
jgi:hypothetical protein